MSTTISTLPSSIVNWLNLREELEDIKFLTEFPPQYKAVPLKKPIVSVGISSVEITDHFTENEDHVLERDEYCRIADVEIVLSIHVPFSMGGDKCHDVFTKVVNCLTFASDLNIMKSSCENISSDRDTEALVMNAHILIKAAFCPSEEVDECFHSFLDKELLCGSHIRNTQIHITDAERNKWNNRFVTGEYFGTGTSTQTVNLGFKPVFLAVFPLDGFNYEYNSSTGGMNNFSGILAGNDYTHGIGITSNGFTVNNGSSYAYSGNTPYLNKLGYTYTYFAIKP